MSHFISLLPSQKCPTDRRHKLSKRFGEMDKTVRKTRKSSAPPRIDVAQAAGVSIATVSAFINGTANVSADLGQRVEKAIRDIGYQRNAIARSLKIGTTAPLGLPS